MPQLCRLRLRWRESDPHEAACDDDSKVSAFLAQGTTEMSAGSSFYISARFPRRPSVPSGRTDGLPVHPLRVLVMICQLGRNIGNERGRSEKALTSCDHVGEGFHDHRAAGLRQPVTSGLHRVALVVDR